VLFFLVGLTWKLYPSPHLIYDDIMKYNFRNYIFDKVLFVEVEGEADGVIQLVSRAQAGCFYRLP
jgi:hypothetical protein